MTAEQVAQVLKIHQFTVLKFIKQGKLKASKLGRVYRIRRADVEQFLDDQTNNVQTVEKTAVKRVPKAIITPKAPTPQPQIEIAEENTNTNRQDHYILELKT